MSGVEVGAVVVGGGGVGGEGACHSVVAVPGHPHQCSYLENPMDRGAQRATVHRVTKSQTQLK